MKTTGKSKLFGSVLVAMLTIFAVTSCRQTSKTEKDTKADKTEQKVDMQDQKAQPESDSTATKKEDSMASLTVKGEILDMSCFMDHGAKGQGHKMCAQGCLDNGLPAGILSKADGQVYLLLENHDYAEAYKKATQHAAEVVTVSGKVVNKHGIKSLIVESVEVKG